jgi:hypothetical protein
MRKGDEVGGLAQAIDDDEDHGLTTNAGQSFDEIHPDVGPNRRGHGQGKKEPRRVEVFGFVALAGSACLDEVLYHPPQVG